MEDDECDFETLSAMLDADAAAAAAEDDDDDDATAETENQKHLESSDDDDISDSELDRLAALVAEDDEGGPEELATSNQPADPSGLQNTGDCNKENQCDASPAADADDSSDEEEDDELAALYARIKMLEAKKKLKSKSKSPGAGHDDSGKKKDPSKSALLSSQNQSISQSCQTSAQSTKTVHQSKSKSPVTKAVPHKLSPDKGQKIAQIEEDIFGSESTNISLEKPLPKTTTHQSTPAKKEKLPQTKSTFYSSKTSAGGDSDSDWEGLDGERSSGLSVEGAEVKNLLQKTSRVAHQPRDQNHTDAPKKTAKWEEKRSTGDIMKSAGLPQSALTNNKQGRVTAKVKDDSNMQTESFSKIRIINPKISSHMLSSLMEGRRFIAASRVSSKAGSQALEGDWVTIAVIVGKTESRKSSKGGDYIIWRLSDLADCDKVLTCFLFNTAYKQHWKNTVGSVIGILNPSLLNNTEKYQSSSETAVSVDNDKKILILGQSKDFSLCRAKTKAGNNCSQFVNLQKGEFCVFHVQSAYKKHSAKRAELQAGYSGMTPKSFEKTIFSKNSITVNYGGQTYTTAGPPTKTKKASSSITLSSLQNHHVAKGGKGQNKVTPLSLHDLLPEDKEMLNNLKSGKTASGKNKDFMDLLSKPTPGAMQFVKHLKLKEKGPDTVSSDKPSAPIVSMSAKDILKQHEREMKQKQQQRKASLSTNSPKPIMPHLGMGPASSDDGFIDLDDHSSKAPVLSRADLQASLAKKKALAKIQKSGGLAKADPNAVKKRKCAADVEDVKKRVHSAENINSSQSSSDACDTPPRKKSRFAGSLDLDSAEVKKLLSARSAHDNMLTEEEQSKMEEYFEVLEKKEQMEEKMASITKVKVTAVHCKQCKYHALGPSAACKEDRHPLEYYQTYKRFFKCKNCSKRTVSIDKIPSLACQNCGSTNYERTTMLVEKKGPTLPQEQLLLRGEETKYLNSLK